MMSVVYLKWTEELKVKEASNFDKIFFNYAWHSEDKLKMLNVHGICNK